MSSPRWTLRLAKEDFKFSVAHFTLFAEGHAETLHGHNYRMTVEVEGESLEASGLVADTEGLKERIRALCARLDDRVLLPAQSPWLEIERDEGSIECRFGARRYRFPADEVVLMPLANTSMELVARWAWEDLAAHLAGSGLTRLAVEIEETSGQSCRYRAPLGPEG